MCGIAGYIIKKPESSNHRIMKLLSSIQQRGPDDEGVLLLDRQSRKSLAYITAETPSAVRSTMPTIENSSSVIQHDLAFIHTRYSIIDLSDAAHQPFISLDGYVIGIFNGEIYNYLELKDELSYRGVKFKSSSDTEVLIEGYRVWGQDLWRRLNGFWAVVLFDFSSDTLILSRDRVGVAPLYYRETPEGFFFASAIKSLIDIDPTGIDYNRDVVLGFAQTGIKDHDNSTCYAQIKSIPASTTVVFKKNQFAIANAKSIKYWTYPDTRFSHDEISFPEAVKEFRELLFNAVELRLRADVKVAFELSGGLDSSSVVAAAAVLRSNDVTTYTAKVENADEEPYARSILKKYPVDYRVIDKFEKGFRHDFDFFSKIMEEPYDNPNAYTHYKMLQRIKSDGVSVVVTGAGGDEILGGYESSFWPKAYQELKSNGFFLRADWYEFCRRFKTIRKSCQTLQHYIIDLPQYVRRRLGIRDKVTKTNRPTAALRYKEQYWDLSFHQLSLYHFNVALIPFYMRSSDHFTMGIPVEHRFPLLDYRMIELCLRMPISYLFKSGWTKYLLRKAMEPYLPRKILWRRRKMGFTFPYRKYLSTHRTIFKPLFSYLQTSRLPAIEFGDYDQLLKENPVMLWRLLSTAIWIKNQKVAMI